jgi:RNA polymerase sigma factor (sigma-70 family)
VIDVGLAARGDRDAFARLVASHANLVCGISLAIVRDRDASEEIAQEVFFSAWRHLAQLRNPASFVPWLRQLTRNAAHEHLRGAARRRRREVSPAVVEAALAAAVDPAPDAQAALIDAEERALVARAIDALPDETREVVTLFYREGRSVEHVARLLDLSEAAVKQRLSRARSRLRADLVARLGDVLARTAPGSALVAAIVAGLSVGVPATASAATVAKLGAATAAGVAGKLIVTGLSVGILGGIAGVLYGFRREYRFARDEDERRGLRRVGLVNLMLVAAFPPLMVFLPPACEPFLMLAFFAGMFFDNLVWLPRVTARRRAAELAEDFAGASRRHRRERLYCWLGLLAGGSVGIITTLQAFFAR